MIEDSAASNAKKKVAISDLLPVFGTEYDSAESLGTSSTTSTAWQTKLTLTTGTLPAGTYMVNWTYEWAGSSASADVDIQVEVDNTTVIMDQRQEPKDPGTDQSNPKGGQVPITLTNATHTIDIIVVKMETRHILKVQDYKFGGLHKKWNCLHINIISRTTFLIKG